MKNWISTVLFAVTLLTSCQTDVKPVVHKGDIAGKSVADLADKIANENNLSHLKIRKNFITGGGDVVRSHLCLWAPNFMSQQKMTLDELRPIAESIALQLTNHLFSDPVFTEYWEDHNARGGKEGSISISDIGYKLTFWDENVNRPAPPYVAQVRFVEGEIRYYMADPESQKLQEPIVEAFSYKKG